MSPDDLHALQLLAELQRLADPAQPATVRVTIRSAEGDYIGDAVLSAPATGHAVQAVSAMADYHDRDRDGFNAQAGQDALVAADIEDYFADLDLDDLTNSVLNDTQPRNRMAVTQAIDSMFGHIPHWDAEDGDL